MPFAMNNGLAEHLQYHRSLTAINLHHHLQTKLEIKKGFMSTCSLKAQLQLQCEI